jgi:hypothetical protein
MTDNAGGPDFGSTELADRNRRIVEAFLAGEPIATIAAV